MESPLVSVLIRIGTSGHDDDALESYPFTSHAPERLIFEPKHISEQRFHTLAFNLRQRGYECLKVLQGTGNCTNRGGTSTWQMVLPPPPHPPLFRRMHAPRPPPRMRGIIETRSSDAASPHGGGIVGTALLCVAVPVILCALCVARPRVAA